MGDALAAILILTNFTPSPNEESLDNTMTNAERHCCARPQHGPYIIQLHPYRRRPCNKPKAHKPMTTSNRAHNQDASSQMTPLSRVTKVLNHAPLQRLYRKLELEMSCRVVTFCFWAQPTKRCNGSLCGYRTREGSRRGKGR